jgi:protein SCO1/2
MPDTRPEDDAEELNIPRWMKVVVGLFSLAIVGAIAFAYFEPVQVLPRIRLAPGYALVDADNETFTSESARGAITLYTFAPAASEVACEACDRINQTMVDVAAKAKERPSLDDLDLRFVTIALDSPTTNELADASARSGADGNEWRWLSGDETRTRNVVGAGFERYYEVFTVEVGSTEVPLVKFDPAFVLVDGNGVVRGEYSYQTLADDAEKITSHLEVLADEIRYAKGAAAVAYEAAHLFLCYP